MPRVAFVARNESFRGEVVRARRRVRLRGVAVQRPVTRRPGRRAILRSLLLVRHVVARLVVARLVVARLVVAGFMRHSVRVVALRARVSWGCVAGVGR